MLWVMPGFIRRGTQGCSITPGVSAPRGITAPPIIDIEFDQVELPAPTGGLWFPFWLALLPVVLLAVLGWSTIQDLRAQRLSTLADLSQDQSDYDLALQRRQQAASLRPGDAQWQLGVANQARMLWNFRDTEALRLLADRAYLRAAALSPSWTVPHAEQARMYSFKGRFAEALAALAPALQTDPNNAGLWLEQARALEALNRRPEALVAYGTCFDLDTVAECGEALTRLQVGAP
jgi:tetratricopeptide (TPR) repeat protein